MRIKVNVDIDNCDDCPFYYYSDLRDVCTKLNEEIPYEEAIEGIHPNCPFVNKETRFDVYWNQREIVLWDTASKSKVCSTDEVTELQKENFKIMKWMMNR